VNVETETTDYEEQEEQLRKRKRLGKRASYRKDRVRDEAATPVRKMLRDKQGKSKSDNTPGNPSGRRTTGLFPEISRTKLAQEMGKCVSAVAGYLQGRRKPGLMEAMQMADLIGVTVRELNWQLARKQAEYRKANNDN
jgi:transcriptional regulator with XRE-family HTH domain